MAFCGTQVLLEKEKRATPLKNRALLFLKPHANTPAVRELPPTLLLLLLLALSLSLSLFCAGVASGSTAAPHCPGLPQAGRAS